MIPDLKQSSPPPHPNRALKAHSGLRAHHPRTPSRADVGLLGRRPCTCAVVGYSSL